MLGEGRDLTHETLSLIIVQSRRAVKSLVSPMRGEAGYAGHLWKDPFGYARAERRDGEGI